jgi:hypothetical protein
MKWFVLFFLVFALPCPSFAIDYRGSCTVVFQASSTLHDIEGNGRCQPFTVEETEGLLHVPALNVAVSGMETGNDRRDRQMREMFEAEQFPLITGTAGSVSLKDFRRAQAAGSGGTEQLAIRLQIRDVTNPVTARVRNLVTTAAKITADLDFSLSLADYQLKPPSVLGIIRVGDQVNVTVSFVLEAQ